MKYIFILSTFLFVYNCCAQEKKETIYLLFDNNSKETCKIETEFSSDNDKNLDGYKIVKKYRKETKADKIIFHICDEKFYFKSKTQRVDTLSIKSLKNIKFKTLDYVQKKYQKGQDFKHHTFKQINIIEKTSKNKIIKYMNVYWCCEWIEE